MFGKSKAPAVLTKVNRQASISIAGEFATIPCRVRRLSDDEAVVALERRRPLPPSFRLTVDREPRPRLCRLKSLDGLDARVSFVRG